jgi:predicted NodU family carbamoyl transferase
MAVLGQKCKKVSREKKLIHIAGSTRKPLLKNLQNRLYFYIIKKLSNRTN